MSTSAASANQAVLAVRSVLAWRSVGVVGVSAEAPALGNHRLTPETTPARAGSPFSWGDMVTNWERYVEEKNGQSLVFIGDGRKNRDDLLVVPYSHRFTDGYTRMQYAKTKGFERGVREEYDDPYIAVLTFSSSTLESTGELRPPLDHLDELLDAWDAGVYYELTQVMNGTRQLHSYDPDDQRPEWDPMEWEYLLIVEPTTDAGFVPGGYAHVHVAVVVDGSVSEERFHSVIDRHVQECDGAQPEAHDYQSPDPDDNPIAIKPLGDVENAGAYLFKYLGKSWNVGDMVDYERRFNALLFDQSRRRFRASNGAQRWMKRPEDDSGSGNWIFAGIANDEQVCDLSEYDGLQDFLIVTNELGIGSWLTKQRASIIEERRREQAQLRERRQKARMTPERFYFRVRGGVQMPWELDRPPP